MLPAQFPGDYYSDDLAKSLDFRGYFDNKRQQQEAFKNQELNRQSFLQDYMQKEKMNPLDIQAKEAGLANMFETTRKAKRANDVDAGIPIDEEIKAERSKLAKVLSDSDLTQAENTVKTALTHPSAAVRKQAEMLWENLSEIKKLRMGTESKENIEAMKAAARKEEADRRQAGTMAAIRARADQSRRDPKSFQEAATRYRILAQEAEAGSPEQAEYTALAREFESAAQTLSVAREAGKVDAGAVAGLPTKKVEPQLGGKQADWVDRAMKANPGMTREQVIEQGKKLGKL